MTRGPRAPGLVLVAAIAACGADAARRADPPVAAACELPLPAGKRATPLRGPIAPPDPRTPETLIGKGYALDAAGIERALAAGDDPTALLAALTAVSLRQCRALLPRVEALLGAPPPTAVEAAATLAEIGAAAPRTRALDVLHGALRDPSWPEVQVTAAAYLGRASDPAAVPALRSAFALGHRGYPPAGSGLDLSARRLRRPQLRRARVQPAGRAGRGARRSSELLARPARGCLPGRAPARVGRPDRPAHACRRAR